MNRPKKGIRGRRAKKGTSNEEDQKDHEVIKEESLGDDHEARDRAKVMLHGPFGDSKRYILTVEGVSPRASRSRSLKVVVVVVVVVVLVGDTLQKRENQEICRWRISKGTLE